MRDLYRLQSVGEAGGDIVVSGPHLIECCYSLRSQIDIDAAPTGFMKKQGVRSENRMECSCIDIDSVPDSHAIRKSQNCNIFPELRIGEENRLQFKPIEMLSFSVV